MNVLRVIGAGMLGVAHLTSEGREALQKSGRVFWIGSVPGLAALLQAQGVPGESLASLYLNGAADVDNYARIKQRLLASLAQGEDVALVVPGHPRVGVSIVQELQAAADDGAIRLECHPGISSFDAMLNDIRMDPLEEGACLVDANRLILYDYAMEPSLNYFIYHVCSIGTARTDFIDPARSSRAGFLAAKLLRHYDPEHPLSLLTASIEPGAAPGRIDGVVGRVTDLLQSVTFAHTLLVPARLPKREQVNWRFLQGMREGIAA
jgi:hypothetical protein